MRNLAPLNAIQRLPHAGTVGGTARCVTITSAAARNADSILQRAQGVVPAGGAVEEITRLHTLPSGFRDRTGGIGGAEGGVVSPRVQVLAVALAIGTVVDAHSVDRRGLARRLSCVLAASTLTQGDLAVPQAILVTHTGCLILAVQHGAGITTNSVERPLTA